MKILCPTCGHERQSYLFCPEELPINWAHGEAEAVRLCTAVQFVIDVLRAVVPLAAAAQMARAS